jgi:DeoR/GlpR family transcriptional regulator of sugar metabolism
MALDIINTYAYVRTTDLAKVLDTSEYITRTCINELYWDGLIIKIRGGAMSKLIQADPPKQLGAPEALSLLHDGMTVLLGEGDTVRDFIGLIPQGLKATFVTGSPFTCIELLKKTNLEVVLLGGKLSSLSKTLTAAKLLKTLPT